MASVRGTSRSLALLLAALAACAYAPARPGSPASPDPSDAAATAGGAAPAAAPAASPARRLAAVRDEVDALLRAEAEALWRLWTRGELPPEPGSARDLASAERIGFVRAQRDAAGGDDRRALSLLHAFLVGEHLSAAAETGPAVAAPALRWDGRVVALGRVPALLAAEPDAERRAALERAWVEAARRGAPAERARWEAILGAARALGYGTPLALAAELRGETPERLAALAEEVLATTAPVYAPLLDALARFELSRPVSQVRGADLPRLWRAGDEARAFPAARGPAHALETLQALGLGLGERPGVVLDADERTGKDPRALALPVDVPGAVRVSYVPAAGAPALRALLHELGAAAYFAHVAAAPVEFRRLGHLTASVWATLFEDLAGDPRWLAERTLLVESHLAPIVRAAVARRLHDARLLATRVLFELARAADPAAPARPFLERGLMRPAGAEELELFALERDPLLASADALHALLLAAQAQAHLGGEDGRWWARPAAGARLRALFADGSRLGPAELARELGAEGVGAAALAARAEARAATAGVRLAHEAATHR
jgi:hypothetical protein